MTLKILFKFISCTGLSLLMTQGAFAASAAQLVTRDIRAAKSSFGQEKRLYHYFNIYQEEAPENQQLLQTPEGRQQLVQERIQHATNKFWSPSAKINGLFAGEGLYLAVDPLISEEYGNVMIEFKVKPEAYYLNLKKGVFFKTDTIAALYKEGYKTREPGEALPESMRFSELSLNAMLSPENRSFRELILHALKAENIMLMEYNWRSELTAVCGEDSSTSAFVYVGTREDLPEFSAAEFVDVKNSHSLKLSNHERVTKEEVQKLLYVMRLNTDLEAREEKVRNELSVYQSEAHIKEVLGSLFGCAQ